MAVLWYGPVCTGPYHIRKLLMTYQTLYFTYLTAYCGHIWSWSLNPQPTSPSLISSNPTEHMKLSSVTLVATTLTAIAGSAIAAPLHAHALEAITNFFGERDVDVNSHESGFALLESRGRGGHTHGTPGHETSRKMAALRDDAAGDWGGRGEST